MIQPDGVFSYLDCSTAHLKYGDLLHLSKSYRRPDSELIVYPKQDLGYFVCVPDDPDINVPNGLKAVISKAILQKCQWIIFDPDGTVHSDLPVYNWD